MPRAMMAALLGLACTAPAAAQTVADVAVINAKIWTGDSVHPEAEALAGWRGRVLAIGTTDEIQKFVTAGTVVINARGRRVVPGFHDSHLHLLGGGLRLNQVALKDAKDVDEFARLIRDFDKKLPRDRWLVGGDWDHDRAFAGKLPTAGDLDTLLPNRPAFLRRYDGHMALANSRALEQAGITEATADPPGGVIDRHPGTKRPTGLLRDNAMESVGKLVPPPSADEVAEGVQAALAELRKAGITSAVDMDGSDLATRRHLYRVYLQLDGTGELTTRVDVRRPLAEWEEIARLGKIVLRGDHLRIDGVKGYFDGSLGSNTAKMFEPYVNDPTTTGEFVTPRDQMRKLVLAADRAGLSIAIHAIGDRANAELLDIFADVAKENGPRDRRLRIEHAQHLRSQDYPRFKELGVVASMQPYHLADDGRWAEGRIGPARCKSSYAYASLLVAGAPVAFGTDWSVAPLNPLLGIDAAVNRRTLDGRHPAGWFPEEKISVAQALAAYTAGSAHASHQEKDRGTLAAGKLADLVMLDRDILRPEEREAIGSAKVILTMVGGKLVFDTRPAAERSLNR